MASNHGTLNRLGYVVSWVVYQTRIQQNGFWDLKNSNEIKYKQEEIKQAQNDKISDGLYFSFFCWFKQ